MMRQQVSRELMQLPPASTPRPGDNVVWYVDAQRAVGQYLGYSALAKPVVRNVFGSQSQLPSYDCLRIREPQKRVGPNWDLLADECFFAPSEQEVELFNEILEKRIPPGPTYREFIEEIWNRGYEVYVVGGTVRDVVSGEKPNDVDLVTTMPLSNFKNLFTSMFKKLVSISEVNGYARLGGKSKEGDPFIDLKIFCHEGTGSANALFGSDFNRDLNMRDFACNSIYYDAINRVLIDPSKQGLDDSRDRILRIVCDPLSRPPTARGQVAIRYFKFLMRGYNGCPASASVFKAEFLSCIGTLSNSHRLAYIQRQIFGKIPDADRVKAKSKLEEVMRMTGNAQIWEQLFLPILE